MTLDSAHAADYRCIPPLIYAIDGKEYLRLLTESSSARSAVAELIAAAREKQRVTGDGPVVTVAEATAAHRRLAAALAACGVKP